jgi:small subunit ribosomal protein S20
MPNLKAAKKDLKQTRARTVRNLSQKKELKASIKEFRKAVELDKKKAGELMPSVFSKLDKASKKNVIDKNKAARLKSRLSRKLAVKS